MENYPRPVDVTPGPCDVEMKYCLKYCMKYCMKYCTVFPLNKPVLSAVNVQRVVFSLIINK